VSWFNPHNGWLWLGTAALLVAFANGAFVLSASSVDHRYGTPARTRREHWSNVLLGLTLLCAVFLVMLCIAAV